MNLLWYERWLLAWVSLAQDVVVLLTFAQVYPGWRSELTLRLLKRRADKTFKENER